MIKICLQLKTFGWTIFFGNYTCRDFLEITQAACLKEYHPPYIFVFDKNRGAFFSVWQHRQQDLSSILPGMPQVTKTRQDVFFLKEISVTVGYLGVSKNRGFPKMDGENNGKPY